MTYHNVVDVVNKNLFSWMIGEVWQTQPMPYFSLKNYQKEERKVKGWASQLTHSCLAPCAKWPKYLMRNQVKNTLLKFTSFIKLNW